ncbi:MAG TPA: VOC family protein [Thermoanaerobaculia bacterium]
MTKTHWLPKRYQQAIPCFTVEGVERLLDFVSKAFEAQIVETTRRADGKIGHAEARIGDCVLMMGESSEQWPVRPGQVYLYVPDVDATYQRALEAGAATVMAPVDTFYGDRNAGVTDPTGNLWWLATHVEDVPEAELEARARAAGR